MGQIITYKNEGVSGVFSQIKFDNGERILVSIANDEIKIFKLILGGSIPAKTIWHYPNLYKFVELLFKKGVSDHPLDLLVNKLITYNSISEVQNGLDNFIIELEK